MVTQEIGVYICKATEWQVSTGHILASKLVQLMIFPGSHISLQIVATIGALGENLKGEKF